MAYYFPLFYDDVILDNGVPAVGAKLYAYNTGTDTPATIYNSTGNAVTQPLIAASDGRVDFRLDPAKTYRIKILSSSNALILQRDNVTAPARGETGEQGPQGIPGRDGTGVNYWKDLGVAIQPDPDQAIPQKVMVITGTDAAAITPAGLQLTDGTHVADLALLSGTVYLETDTPLSIKAKTLIHQEVTNANNNAIVDIDADKVVLCSYNHYGLNPSAAATVQNNLVNLQTYDGTYSNNLTVQNTGTRAAYYNAGGSSVMNLLDTGATLANTNTGGSNTAVGAGPAYAFMQYVPAVGSASSIGCTIKGVIPSVLSGISAMNIISRNADGALQSGSLTSVLGDYVPYTGADAALNMGSYSISASRLNLSGANASPAEGDIWYDTESHTLCVKSDITGQTLNVGQEQVVRAVNISGSPILNGKIVYVSGAYNAFPQINLADNTSETSDYIIGVVTADILDSSVGYVTTNGVVHDINTSAFDVGDRLFLGTSGNFTNVKPTGTAIVLQIGYVLTKNATTGSVLVSVHNPAHLADLHDVLGGVPTSGNILIGDGSYWTSSPFADQTSGFVPYTGATTSVNLGSNGLSAGAVTVGSTLAVTGASTFAGSISATGSQAITVDGASSAFLTYKRFSGSTGATGTYGRIIYSMNDSVPTLVNYARTDASIISNTSGAYNGMYSVRVATSGTLTEGLRVWSSGGVLSVSAVNLESAGSLSVNSSGADGININNTIASSTWNTSAYSLNGINWNTADTSTPGVGVVANIIVNNTSALNTAPVPKMDFGLRSAGTGGYLKNAMTLMLVGATSAATVSAAIDGDFAVIGNTTFAGNISAVNTTSGTITSAGYLGLDSTGKIVKAALAAGGVSSVSAADSTLTITPTTGAVTAKINLGNANTWTANQTVPKLYTGQAVVEDWYTTYARFANKNANSDQGFGLVQDNAGQVFLRGQTYAVIGATTGYYLEVSVGAVTPYDTGASTLGSASKRWGATYLGSLDVSGNTTLGDASSDTLTVSATSTFSAVADFNADLRSHSTGVISMQKASVSTRALQSSVAGDTIARFSVNADGQHNWGPGGVGAIDTNLYRAATDTLKTDDNFVVGGLSGVGSRMVVADSAGLLGTQAVPSVGLTTITTRTGSASTSTTEQYIRQTGSADYTESLPAATGSGRVIRLSNRGVGTWTIDPNASETINGETSVDLDQYDTLSIVDAASGLWEVI